ncbi:MAG: TRAP transporter substrate-binding protein DctP [Thermodesulfobacteriota bacterium]
MRRLDSMVMILVCCLMAFFLTQLPSAHAADPIVLKAVSHLAPDNPHCRNNAPFIEMVNKRAKGELIIKFLGGPEAIPSFDQPMALKKGTIDILPLTPTSWFKPMMGGAADISGLSQISAWKERETGAFEVYDELFRKFANAKYLGRPHGGWGFNFYTNKKIEKLDDFKGLNIRVMSLYAPFTKALGASPVTLAPPELYNALERRIVDGYMFPTFGITGYAWHEVTKYKIEPQVFQAEPATIVNLDTWNKLPKHLQELLADVAKIFEYFGVADPLWVKEEEEYVIAKSGMRVITLPPKDAAAFYNLAYETTWKKVLEESPEYGARLQPMLKKEAVIKIKQNTRPKGK